MADQSNTTTNAQDDTPFMRLLTAFENYQAATIGMGDEHPSQERETELTQSIAQLETEFNAYVDERIRTTLGIEPGMVILVEPAEPSPDAP